MRDLLEDGHSTGGSVHERQERERAGTQHRSERKTVLRAVREEPGSLTAKRETVQDTGGAEEEGISGGESGSEDAGVDDMRKDLDACAGHSNDVGGFSSSPRCIE